MDSQGTIYHCYNLFIFFRNQENFDTWAKQIDQEKFKLEFCLFLNCSLQVCEERILKRAADGGRADDNLGMFYRLGLGIFGYPQFSLAKILLKNNLSKAKLKQKHYENDLNHTKRFSFQ